MRRATALFAILILSLTVLPAAGAAAPVPAQNEPAGAVIEDLPHPLEQKRRGLRQEAVTQVVNGEAQPVERGPSTVLRVGRQPDIDAGGDTRRLMDRQRSRSQYVELARETTDRVFVVLAEFGNERAPDYPDQDTDPNTPGPVRFDGPDHNEIPKPDRSVDNSTIWQPDYDRAHYEQVYFGEGDDVESVKEYYERQSSGRYSIDGTVTDWVKVRYNQARYGRSGGFPCASIVCSNTWDLLAEAVDQWVADKQAAGMTDDEIAAELATFDEWDRYDFDGDGNFNERDGYIDHFQIVHAGGDEADGDPVYGEDAIWSHRWYAFFNGIGQEGPDGNPLGGTEIGDTGVWIGDYTIQPENGGLGVFVHEYGHDLGLPDHYDTSGGGDNPVNWWTLMAQSRVSAEQDEAIGTRAADLSAWDKLQLGWFDYEVVPAGNRRTLNLGPHEYNSRRPQGVVIPLPAKEVSENLAPPYAGDRSWWSSAGDNLSTTLSREVTLPADAAATLEFQAWYDIEDCGPDPCDYAFVEVDDGNGWAPIPGSITSADEGNGIDGTSDGWVPATFDLSAYAGQSIGLRLAYRTDGAVGGLGFFADQITVTAGDEVIFTDGAEDGDGGWTADGFTAVGATRTAEFDHYYLASYRAYLSYDRYLRTGPYNFGFTPEKPDLVEHFPYQDGLLVSYWDTSQSDNNTSQHPGEGLVLPIDANPDPLYRLDGEPWRGRIQTYDAPFSVQRSDSFRLHLRGQPSWVRGRRAQPVFNDRRSYWDAEQPNVGVKVPNAGVRIRVQRQRKRSMRIRIGSTN